MYTIRKNPKNYYNHLRLVEEAMTENPPKFDEAGTPEPQFDSIPITFVCPPGFQPAAFIITAINAQGQHFTNAPTAQPHLSLRLATLALDFASQHAVLHIQRQLQKESPILTVPPGTTIPNWNGPEGRG